ncbi:HEPN domain-containing protein [Brachybacterium sp. NPDC056505]|uniref:HEPN domain-containing protein n=1 Tax=Brachybacterium sp. NPDC056505 TaxID=3345843 RepID=UPI003672A0E5
MPATAAHAAFQQNSRDVDRLMEFHRNEGGSKKGRRWRLEVLNKSAIVLLCAAWEAYCEDVVGAVVAHYVDHAPVATKLPHALKEKITGELTAKGETYRVWELAGDGWRDLLRSRLADLKTKRDRDLNTPKADRLRVFFRHSVGCDDITKHWSWRRTTPAAATERLDAFVELRGSIAHRAEGTASVTKRDVMTTKRLVRDLVNATDAAMIALALDVTGTPMRDTEPTNSDVLSPVDEG